jgi:hypothetical protein
MPDNTVTMIDPQGIARQIPQEQVDTATQAGAKPSTKILDPQGNPRWIPNDQVNAALQAGGKRADLSGTVQPSTTENLAQGFGASAAEGLTGLGKIAGKIPGAKYAAEKVGDVLGLPKLPEGTNPYAAVEKGIQPAVKKATETTAGKIGYGGETLTEFLLGDEALKGLSLGDRLLQISKVAKVFENSPRLMRATQIGAEALRQGTVQAVQTEAKSGGDVKKAAEEGGTMAGVSAALGGAGAVASGLLSKAGKAAQTVETLGKVAEAAPAKEDVTEAAKSAIDSAKKEMHTNYDKGVQDIASRLKGKSLPMEGSPLEAKATELKKTAAEYPEGLTKEQAESLKGLIPGTKRGQKLLETLTEIPKEGTKTPLTIDNLIKYRESLGKVARDLPHDDPNIKTIYGLIDGVDDTIEKMAKESGDKTLPSDYDALRQVYKDKVKFFQPSKKPEEQLAYNTAKVLRSGVKDDVGRYLLTGGNIRAKVNSIQELLGPDRTQELGKNIFSTMVKDASPKGRINPANLIASWNKIPNEVKSDLFDTKIGDQAIQELAKDTKSAAQIQHLARLGLIGGIGATGVGSVGHVWIGTLLGLTIGEVAHGGVQAARNMLDYVTTHPAVWKSLGLMAKGAEKVAPIAKVLGPAAKQQAAQTLMGKPSIANVYEGAEGPLSEEQAPEEDQ